MNLRARHHRQLNHCVSRRSAFAAWSFSLRDLRLFATFAWSLILASILSFALAASAQTAAPTQSADIISYIDKGWTTLSRSAADCKTIADLRNPNKKETIYFPADQPLPPIAADLQKRCGVEAKQLPKPIHRPGDFDADHFTQHGVLYLPNPYVVPGGFFNEMYGWDSYFILRGLIEANRLDLARGQVENFFYEIEHYGAILNANRTYFLSRSQPPFLSSMVMAVYDAKPDKQWLEKAYTYIERDYRMWTSGQHLAGDTGLSRYYDYGQGPTPDIAATGDPYYSEMIGSLLARGYITDYFPRKGQTGIGPEYRVEVCTEDKKQPCAKPVVTQLTADYYKGDRAMRESGFDISNRFAPYSGHTHHFAPVCLNSLLYKTERDMQKIAEILGRPADARQWADRANLRVTRMNKLLWNAAKGMYFDYDFTTNRQSPYVYATTFYPLWVGLATPAQAQKLIPNLKIFEQPGGIVMSPYETHLQWDYPYGWAPLQLITVEGLLKYDANDAAKRIANEWLSMVTENFRRDGTIREKYNVVTRSDEQNVSAGYHENVIGFGWTNGTFLVLKKVVGSP